jgi:hypothetical protein
MRVAIGSAIRSDTAGHGPAEGSCDRAESVESVMQMRHGAVSPLATMCGRGWKRNNSRRCAPGVSHMHADRWRMDPRRAVSCHAEVRQQRVDKCRVVNSTPLQLRGGGNESGI